MTTDLPTPRPASPRDADELTRLHVEGGLGQEVTDAWRTTHTTALARRLFHRDPHLVAIVLDAPDRTGLASAAVGFIHQALCRPDNPRGLTAHLSSVVTMPEYRHRGYARAVTTAFIGAVRGTGCSLITLTATAQTTGLYRELGFTDATSMMRCAEVTAATFEAPRRISDSVL